MSKTQQREVASSAKLEGIKLSAAVAALTATNGSSQTKTKPKPVSAFDDEKMTNLLRGLAGEFDKRAGFRKCRNSPGHQKCIARLDALLVSWDAWTKETNE
jgi:hypothetical protein